MKTFFALIFFAAVTTVSSANSVKVKYSVLNCLGFKLGSGGIALTYLTRGDSVFSMVETNAFNFPVKSTAVKMIDIQVLGNKRLLFKFIDEAGMPYSLAMDESGEGKFGKWDVMCTHNVQPAN